MRGRGLKLMWVDDYIGIPLSPPMRGRGLKQSLAAGSNEETNVAPHAGAWIETMEWLANGSFQTVAPHAGAWIETMEWLANGSFQTVAPHAGAWIET